MPISFTTSVTCAQCGFGHHFTSHAPIFDPDDLLESLLATVNYVTEENEVFCSDSCRETWLRKQRATRRKTKPSTNSPGE
jgi:hypothetical protein